MSGEPSPMAGSPLALRPYQTDSIESIRQAIASGRRRIVLQSPTGSGKTHIMAALVHSSVAKDKSVLVLAPRRELVRQVAEKLTAVGVRHSILMAGERDSRYERVQVASVLTLHRRAIVDERITLPTAHLILVDEAHLSITRSARNILDAYPNAVVVGFTATPARSDGRGLGEFFEEMVMGPPIADLTREGYLVPARYYAPSKPDLDGIRIRRGDFDEKQLAERVDRPRLVGDVVSNWHRLASDQKTVVFAASIRHSIHLRDRFLDAGVAAEHLDANTPNEERAAILERLATGETRVLCNVFVLAYGWDCPPVSCAVLARPTKSVCMYLQTVGRVLRPYPGKETALILDHAGAVDEFGFVDDPIPWTLNGTQTNRERTWSKKLREAETVPTPCPKCDVVFSRRPDCPNCGYLLERKGKPLEFIDGDLAEMTPTQRKNARVFTLADKASYFGQLKSIAKERGYRPGWAAHRYKSKFGVWPNSIVKGAPLIAPTPEVRAWVKGQDIRRAKAHQKEVAA